MNFTRRDFGKFALGSIPAAGVLLANPGLLSAMPRAAAGKPDSVFRGVQIGVIAPYSYRSEGHYDAKTILADIVGDGISGCEIEALTPESYAGAPPVVGLDGQASPNGAGMFSGGARRGPAPARRGGEAGARRGGAARRGPGGGRPAPTPEQLAAQKKAQDELTKWRLSVPMSKYESFRSLYNAAGVQPYALKLTLALYMPDAEFDYAFNVAKAIGAKVLQMEYPNDAKGLELTGRIGDFAAKHKMMVGYHAHLDAKPDLWDKAMAQSPWNGINLDVGHYVAAGNHDVIEFIKKNHARITTLHLKDRHYPQTDRGSNEPWGQGDTPLVQILQLMRDNHYGFPGSIELEYQIPAGSTANKEVAKCVAYAKKALES